jgi:hypothetical protein
MNQLNTEFQASTRLRLKLLSEKTGESFDDTARKAMNAGILMINAFYEPKAATESEEEQLDIFE